MIFVNLRELTYAQAFYFHPRTPLESNQTDCKTGRVPKARIPTRLQTFEDRDREFSFYNFVVDITRAVQVGWILAIEVSWLR